MYLLISTEIERLNIVQSQDSWKTEETFSQLEVLIATNESKVFKIRTPHVKLREVQNKIFCLSLG